MKKQIYSLLFLFLISISYCFAQPANDACAGAIGVTPDGTCVAGTTVGAGDHWIGSLGCAGNNDEVWYRFIATGTEASITVTNGTMGGNIEFILVEATGACAGLSLEGSLCGASPLTGVVSNTLTIGATYYYTISSTGADGTFTSCITTTTPPPTPGQDCPTADIWCSAADFSVGNVAAGAGTISGNASNENLSALGCLLADERRPQWYKFTVGATGTLEFLIDPITNTDDYDWAVYNITTSGCALTPGGSAAGGATQIACNFSGCPGNTGIIDAGTECATTNFLTCANGGACNAGDVTQFSTAPPTLTAGQTYALVIDNFTASVNGFNFTWGSGTVAVGAVPDFTTSLSADCMTLTVNRGTAYTGANMTYLWNFGDGFTSTAGVPAAHTYALNGNYTVSLTVTDALGCIKNFSSTINVGCVLPIELLSFDAKKNGTKVDLGWATASEINNDYFTVERSNNGAVYEPISTVDGAGNSSRQLNYTSIDPQPFEGLNYYRLKQTDFNGTKTYSDVKVVEIEPAEDLNFSIIPNPSNAGEASLFFTQIPRNEISISITDMVGRSILSKKMLVKDHSIEIGAGLSQGVYMISVTGAESVINKKMIIK